MNELPTKPENEKRFSHRFWLALFALVVLVLVVQISTLVRTQPRDVLQEVQQLRAELSERTIDRFFRKEFENFLKENPELNPPTIRVEVIAGEEVITQILVPDDDDQP